MKKLSQQVSVKIDYKTYQDQKRDIEKASMIIEALEPNDA
jgi:hypothetical protein